METDEIRELIAKKISGQGSMIDIGNGLEPVLEKVCNALDDIDAEGITSVEAYIDANVGTPSVEVTLENKCLTLFFHNLKGNKGDQGNSGYSGAAGELEVVNNLSDGGATAALSAEMGKRLNEEISELAQKDIVSDALAGLVFDDSEQHQLAKDAIKAVWLTYGQYVSDAQRPLVDALRESLANTKLYITSLYNVSGTYGCFLRIDDAASNGNNCFSKYVAGIHTITGNEEVWGLSSQNNTIVWPSDSGITAYPFVLYFAIDWNILNDKTITREGSHAIQINFGELNWGGRVETKTLQEEVEEISQEIKPLASIDLTDKTIVCIGDSLTEMVDTTNSKHYSDYFSERTGAKTINIGFGGTQLRQRREMADDFDFLPEDTQAEIAEKTRYAYATIDVINLIKAITSNDYTEQTKAVDWLKNHGDDNTAILARAKAIDWTKVDGVIIFAGTNDWPSNNPTIGTPGSTDVNFTLGAVNEIIRILLTTFKQLKIYWFTPIVRWEDYSGGVGDVDKWSDVLEFNQQNGTLREFSAAIENEVKTNHIPVCDLYNTLGINKANFSNYFLNNDGVHPRTLNGVTMLAKKIGAFILANNSL